MPKRNHFTLILYMKLTFL